MPDIVLTALNAKYIHASFGLRYLLANLGDLQSRACLVEFDLSQRPLDIAEKILSLNPRILGLGVYVWNAILAADVVALLKRICPPLVIVLGGPEVSFESEQQPIVSLADYAITGEADLKFAELCHSLLADSPPAEKILPAEPPDLDRVMLPYDLYDTADIAHRILYVEATRGCPFDCEFCLSSLDVPWRRFPLPHLLSQLQSLLERGARQFKFVDRTFNVHLPTAEAILDFFLERCSPGLFLHFEMVPDRMPESLRDRLRRFPPGALQFEMGVQTFNPEVAERIRRRQDYSRLEENFRFLRTSTGVHLHADLIVGLPGESVESFGAGFDRLVALGPQEIQVGMLKRLRGAPIARHDAEWEMVYQPQAPYEILRNKLIDFGAMQRLRRFARYWDLIANSGHFVETTPLLWRSGGSPFAGFMRCSDWLFSQVGRNHAIALARLAELLFRFLTGEAGQEPQLVAESLGRDLQRGGARDQPEFLRTYLRPMAARPTTATQSAPLKRQARHRRSSPD